MAGMLIYDVINLDLKSVKILGDVIFVQGLITEEHSGTPLLGLACVEIDTVRGTGEEQDGVEISTVLFFWARHCP